MTARRLSILRAMVNTATTAAGILGFVVAVLTKSAGQLAASMFWLAIWAVLQEARIERA